ncbi:sigma factor-like helix-turn-helix DNA-binding protein [Kocuria sp. CPCC 205292]|uniref:sigma factor-like helix-turn-helix DNA-binding protein n=1 Tax=Kocuria cellulosilytica TaxID=3071451 RepID=UPI0034D48129
MIENPPFDSLRPRSWLDAFPWIKGAADPHAEVWWNDAIDDTGAVVRRQRLAQIAELAMERLTRWTIGQVFPGLSPEIELQRLELPVRAVNALGRRGIVQGADIASLTLESIMDWQQVGIGTVDAMLQALADVSTSLATPPVMTLPNATSFEIVSIDEYRVPNPPSSSLDEYQSPISGTTLTEEVRLPDYISSLANDLTQIARWYATIGLHRQQLLSSSLPLGAPDEILKARLRLEELRTEDVLDEAELGMDIASLFDRALNNIDKRAVHVLANRLFADDAMTLDELGHAHGVTRERIRQIEGKARGAMLGCIVDGSALEMVADTVRTLTGTIRPLKDLLAVMPALGKMVKSVQQPAWRVLDRLEDVYEIEDGWCVVPTMSSAQTMTQTQLQERANAYGVVLLDDLNLVETSRPECRIELTTAWLTYCGYIIEGGHVLTRTQSVGDYGAAILSIAGSPLSAQEILDRFVFERSAGSLRNAMGTDERFERVDRDLWALKEWGLEAYAGIRSIIREQVAHSRGRAELNELVEYITGQYTVSASSVIAYASAPPFTCRGGIVRLAVGDREIRKTPEQTRRMFRRPGAWSYRVRITTDHLRGSGSAAPMAIASILDLQFGETRQLESRLGPQSVAWTGSQPQFGTIRRFLMEGDVATGTEAFLVIHDNGTFTFEVAPDLTGNPLVDALILIGAPTTTGINQARADLTAAIGLPEASPVNSLIGGYRDRGDSDIADLLIDARQMLETGQTSELPTPQADVDAILDLL